MQFGHSGNPLTDAYPGRPADFPLRAWGDGFVDLALSTQWYARGWSDVSDDELVLFLPSILEADDAQNLEAIATRIRYALIRRLRASVLILDQGNKARTLKDILAASAISCLTKQDILATAADHGVNYEARSIAERCRLDREASWQFESAVLGSIDRTLAETLPSRAKSEDCKSVDLAEILLASIHTSINVAYVYPSLTFAHELLGTGAWLGILLRGRSAFMPEFVAQVLIDHLVRAEPPRNRADSGVINILRDHAEMAGGASRLIRTAQRVLKSNHHILVTPKRPTRAMGIRIWDRLWV
jgi:hypothetical protein